MHLNNKLPTGVYYRENKFDQPKFYSKAMVNKKWVWLGTFNCPNAASEKFQAYKKSLKEAQRLVQ